MDNLRRDVVRRPAERLGRLPARDVLLAHPEVGDLDVAVLVEHDVVQLEVPVHHAVAVKVHDSDQNLSSVKTEMVFC